MGTEKQREKEEKRTEVLEAFVKHLRLRHISSYDRYEKYVKEFLQYLESSDIDYTSITAHVLDDYRAFVLAQKKGCARGTVNNRLTRIKSFYRFLIKKQLIASNPFTHYKGLKRGTIIPKNILSVEETGILLDNFSVKTDADLMMYSMVELLYGSSLRISEVSNLTIGDIDFKRGYVYITSEKTNGGRLKVPATEVSLHAVKRYMKYAREKLLSESEKQEDRLYPRQSESTHRCLLNRKLKAECRRLGLKPVSTHSFRHSSATHMLRKGAGIREVQALLGHTRLSSTEIYTRVLKDDLKHIVKTFHPREQEAAKDG